MKNIKGVLNIKSISEYKKVIVANIPYFFCLFFVIFITYVWGIKGEFVSDDIPGIIEYPIIKDFPAVLRFGQIQPIIQSSLYHLFGFNEIAFHSFSIIFHFIISIMFFLISFNLFGKKVAALATLLFSVHPVNVETVVWISALNYLLNTFFVYITVILYLLYKSTNKISYLVYIGILFLLFILTFQSFWIFLIPLILVTLEFFFLNEKDNYKSLIKIIPYFIIAVFGFFWMSRTRLAERITALDTPEAAPFLNRLPYSIFKNAEILVWPNNLSLYHEGTAVPYALYAFMIVFSIFLIFYTIKLWKKPQTRVYAGLIAMIYVSIAPVFSPQQVAWFIAERYLYIATGFFSILLVKIFINLENKHKNTNLALILTLCLLIPYSVRSMVRSNDWSTQKNLWLSTVKKSPFSARAHNNLADSYGKEGNWQMAVFHFERAIMINPMYAEAIHNLGNTYMLVGNFEPAKNAFFRSLEINPNLYQSVYKLGLIAYAEQDENLAIEYFTKALEIEPSYEPAANSLLILQQKSQ